MGAVTVYGIGNPLIDVVVTCTDEEIETFGLAKGTMHLIDPERGASLLAALAGKEKRYSCGGSSPNTMIALATFGTTSALGGTLGNDELGGIYVEQLRSFGVESRVSTAEGATGTSIIMVSPDSERTMNTHLGVCQRFCREEVDFELVEAADYLHFTGYMWDTEPQQEAIAAAVERARATSTTIVFDVADPFAVKRNRKDFLSLIDGAVDIVFANRREAELMLDTDRAAVAAERLAEHTALAIVKDGADGSYIAERGGRCLHIPADVVEPVDTTGAGDMYAAGFLHGLASGGTIQDAGSFASLVAARIITQTGAQLSRDSADSIRKEYSYADNNSPNEGAAV